MAQQRHGYAGAKPYTSSIYADVSGIGTRFCIWKQVHLCKVLSFW